MSKRRISPMLLGLLMCLLPASYAGAIEVSPSTYSEVLASALLGSNGGIVITSSALEYCSGPLAMSSGTYTNVSGVYGAGPGVVLSTGDVSLCADDAASELSHNYGVLASDEISVLLTPITGSAVHFDATRLDIWFDLLPGYGGISIDTVFGSEEYPRYQGTSFNDGMGIYLNGVNIAIVDGLPINISNPNMSSIPGTGINGILAPNGVPLLSFTKFLGNGAPSNHLTIVIGDATDPILDSVAFVGNLRAHQVPEPASIVALGLMAGYAMLAGLRRRLG